MKHAGQITAALMRHGRDRHEPCAVICNATTPQQQVIETTLSRMEGDIAASGLEPPALLCVGRAVLMRQVLDWQEQMLGAAPRDLNPLGRGPG